MRERRRPAGPPPLWSLMQPLNGIHLGGVPSAGGTTQPNVPIRIPRRSPYANIYGDARAWERIEIICWDLFVVLLAVRVGGIAIYVGSHHTAGYAIPRKHGVPLGTVGGYFNDDEVQMDTRRVGPFVEHQVRAGAVYDAGSLAEVQNDIRSFSQVQRLPIGRPTGLGWWAYRSRLWLWCRA